VGRVNVHDCDHVKGLIALSVVGQLSEGEILGLRAHLDGCRECREDERALRATAELLPAADLDHLEEHPMPAGLPESVLDRLRGLARAERRTRNRRRLVGSGAAAGAAAAAVIALAFFSLGGGSASKTRTFALSGSPGVRASVQLTAETWGTSVRIVETGQPGAQVMWVSMHTRSGGWWQTGTYRSMGGRSVRVKLACALNLSQIESVWVRNSKGDAVLHGYVS
jgi:anti-sigma factor RsiW